MRRKESQSQKIGKNRNLYTPFQSLSILEIEPSNKKHSLSSQHTLSRIF